MTWLSPVRHQTPRGLLPLPGPGAQQDPGDGQLRGAAHSQLPGGQASGEILGENIKGCMKLVMIWGGGIFDLWSTSLHMLT